ncbi:hypothetical protein V496_09166 [Pseudogymnoascus sp. VKM F-4515 (FW-2607)]|nr:hypothetical protein V496_09166 [Pseudogymnoascus sp. VKM F-4515 (FW-2607)]
MLDKGVDKRFCLVNLKVAATASLAEGAALRIEARPVHQDLAGAAQVGDSGNLGDQQRLQNQLSVLGALDQTRNLLIGGDALLSKSSRRRN